MDCKSQNDEVESSFVYSLTKDLELIDTMFYASMKPIQMDESDIIAHNASNKCFMCLKPFCSEVFLIKEGPKFAQSKGPLPYIRYKITKKGKYRGAAHSICNLKYSKVPSFVPIFFHNLGTKYLSRQLRHASHNNRARGN